ncbi:hypothetical protein IAR55_005450 [Kwoniella newhampshirensis]|uniref:Uncharacterized protein n=1 Tax=Kwoniella newhampshirensis TaxID=1651941 RepID=A0AAW0YVW8_9TREE
MSPQASNTGSRAISDKRTIVSRSNSQSGERPSKSRRNDGGGADAFRASEASSHAQTGTRGGTSTSRGERPVAGGRSAASQGIASSENTAREDPLARLVTSLRPQSQSNRSSRRLVEDNSQNEQFGDELTEDERSGIHNATMASLRPFFEGSRIRRERTRVSQTLSEAELRAELSKNPIDALGQFAFSSAPSVSNDRSSHNRPPRQRSEADANTDYSYLTDLGLSDEE